MTLAKFNTDITNALKIARVIEAEEVDGRCKQYEWDVQEADKMTN